MKNKIYLMTIFCILTGYCGNLLRAQTGPGGVPGASLWLKADAGINSSSVTYFNVPAANRTASSTYNDASLTPAYSTLSSSSAWAASSAVTGQYLTLDLGSVQTVYGVVTKGRQGSYAQWVKKYTVSYSNDNVTYTPLGITFPGNIDQNTEATNIFPSAITARYVRVTETDYNSHPCMRVDLIKNVNPFSAGDSSVHLWQDQSGNGMNFMRRGATAPVYQNSGAAGTNFNPVIQFNGSNYFENYVSVPSANNTNYTKFAVFNTTGTTGNIISAADPGNSAFYLSGGSLYLYHNGNLSNPVPVSNNVPVIGTGVWSNGTSNGTYIKTNGKSGTAFTSSTGYTAGGLQIGAFQSGTNIPASSTIAETIVFSSALSPAQINKVESYLAMKYGVTLDPQNYVAGDGTVIWNSGTNSGYNNNIAGIGWDYDSGLIQKQSQSVNGGFQPVIGNGNIAATNAGNSNSFNEDGTFMVWGSDTGSTNFSTAFSYGGLNYRMARTWKVQKTKTIAAVKIAVPVSLWLGSVTKPSLLVSGTTVFVADTNANNSNDFAADKTFMVWGSDTGSANFATSFAFGGLNNRMGRIWKIQETGTVGKVRVALKVSDLPGSITKPTLLVSGDTTFDASDSTFLMTKETIGGVDYYVTAVNANIDFSSGQYFSFAALVTAPGGVLSSLGAWWKADYSASGTAWADASSNGRNASIGGGTISYKNGDFTTNFNPQLTTDGGWMSYTNPVYPNGSNYDNMNIFAIGQPVSGKVCAAWGEKANNSNSSSTNNASLFVYSNDNEYFDAPYGYRINTAFSSNAGVYGASNLIEGWKSGVNMKMYLQGKQISSYTTGGGNYYSTGDANHLFAYSGQASTGNSGLSEVVAYNSPLGATDRIRVNSYMAIKYGISLSNNNDGNTTVNEVISGSIREGDYIASDNTIFWTGSATYQNNIAGIG